MASALTAGLAAVLALAFCWTLGLPLALRLFDDRNLAVASAPLLGWAAFSAAALPILSVAGLNTASAGVLGSTAALASLAARPSVFRARAGQPMSPAVPPVAWLFAVLFAALPAIALLPKELADGGVLLASPIFDHSKVAIVDEIARNGLPVQNPFYGAADADFGLAYYYLWHVSAAMLSLIPGVSGWEADIALTAFTAFATLALVMGLAVRAAGRGAAAFWAVALSVVASARPALSAVVGPAAFGGWLSDYPGLGALLVQTTWAPQHVMAAACVVLAVLLIDRLAQKPNVATAAVLGLVAAAAFGASVWVGGFVFALAAGAVGAVRLLRLAPDGRRAFALWSAAAIVLAAAAAFPILRDQLSAAAARPEGLPLAIHPYEVLGPNVAASVRRALDVPAYWAILLPIDLPAIYATGAIAMAGAVFAAGGHSSARSLAVLSLVAFGVAWLLISTVLNNDLGWRAVLPGTLVLTAFAAAGLARWTARPVRPIAALAAVAALAAGLPDGVRIVTENALGRPSPSAGVFARSPAIWEAVRRHSGPTERIASDPSLFADMTHWPINISWALFADRRSCYAGWEFARPFAPIPRAEVDRLDRSFKDAFAGVLTPDETFRLFVSHDCRLIVRTRMDGEGRSADPFAGDRRYLLVEEEPAASWRLYRIAPAEPR